MKVLVIDDEKPTLSMFKLFLSAYGYDVHTAEDGETGVEMFRDLLPDIVFTDIKMPGIDGLEVLARIRKMDPGSQVVIITGHGDMEKAVEALDLGASDFINKPVERQALNAALERAEARRKLPPDIPFDLTLTPLADRVDIRLKGQLTGVIKPRFKTAYQDLQSTEPRSVQILLDDSFSVDRSGISLLTDTLQRLKQSGFSIVFKEIPYNFSKVFQMAGIDKLAQLEEQSLQD
ncbi:MAG: response regulator [Desulfobacteraceae bacterium]|nr:MAG: response regulator [Desulfobacteraceae bacterium]